MTALVLLLTCCVPLGKCLHLSFLRQMSGFLHPRPPGVLLWQGKAVCAPPPSKGRLITQRRKF